MEESDMSGGLDDFRDDRAEMMRPTEWDHRMGAPFEYRGTDGEGAARLRERLVRRVGWAAVIGPVVGTVGGIIIGDIAFRIGSTGFWMVLSAFIVFSTAVALLIAGYSSFESPDPSTEPSEVEREPREREPGAGRDQGST
jgi:hypothetical protein